LGTLSEPRRKQNLYANPKRTAKSFFNYTFSDAPVPKRFKLFSKNLAHFSAPFFILYRRQQASLLTI
jgi:hypothetical protein